MEHNPHMQTIQVVIDEKLLRAANQAAKKRKVNRSAFIREALAEHLHRLHMAELERREREGYERYPDDPKEAALWAKVAAWPEE